MFEMPQNIVHHCICKLRAFLANCNFSALLCSKCLVLATHKCDDALNHEYMRQHCCVKLCT